MEEDIDEVLLRLTNKSVMQDKSNAKCNLTSTNNVLDLESESDDCCTSVSQRPVNPLSVLGTPVSNSLPLPAVKMVTYDRFWQGQAENLANDNKDDYTELSSSVGTFSMEPKKRHPVIFSEWCPILRNRKLQITGVTIDGSVESRSIDRRISGYIFYDISEVPCSLGGPMTVLNSQPKFIQHKFALGIPEDWVQVQSIWNSFETLGSPENFPWLSSTDLDTSDPTIAGYDQSVIRSTKMAISTPRNITTDFYNITTDISKINASGGQRSYQQKLFHNTVNSSASRSMKKTYTSAALKKKMNRIRSMLKVTLMRECSKLTSFNELVEMPESDLNMRTCNAEVPVDNGVPQLKTIASDSNNEYLLQNKLPDQLVIKNLSKINVNMPTTSQSTIIELVEPANSLHNKLTINNMNADSLKTTTNVFLNKSQFLSNNKSCNAVKDISSCSKTSDKTKLHVAEVNNTKIANVSQKCQAYVSQKDNLPSEMSELSVTANQSSKTNSSEKKIVKNSAGFNVSVNNSKKDTPPTSSTDDLCNYVPSNITRKHRNSLTLLLNKIGIEHKEHKSASNNSSEIDHLDFYPTNSDSVVISYHNSNQIDVPSDVSSKHTTKNNLFVVENVSRSLKNSLTDNIHNDKAVQSEEHQLESSWEDSIFSSKSKKAGNTNKGKFNAPIRETSVNKDNQYMNQTTKVMSNQNSNQINKEVPANVDISHHVKNQNNHVRNQNVFRNKILFSSESSDDDDNQNTNQINKAANTNVEISNSDKNLNPATKTIEEIINTSNSESSVEGSVESILVNEIIVQSSNSKSKLGSESSDNSETQESHEIFVTNAVVHSAVKASVKSDQVSPTLQEHQSSNINKSDTRMNRKAIVEKSNDNLEIISSVKELTDDKSVNRSKNKMKSPEKRNRDNSSLKRKDNNKKSKKSHREDEATNQNIIQEDSRVQFTEETIQEQNLTGPKQTPNNSKVRDNTKRETDTIQTEKSISTNLTLEFDLCLNNTTFSRKGRARCPTLPFWTGARLVTIGDDTMVTKVSALNLSNKAVENKKRFLTPQKQTIVAKKARTNTQQKSPVRVHNSELTVLSPASSTGPEQQNKNIANARTRTPKNTKNVHSASKNITEKSRVKTTKNRKLNMLSCSSNDTKSNNFVDNIQNSNTRNSRSRNRSQIEYNKINEKSVTEVLSSEICTSPIMNERLLTPQHQTSVAQSARTETSQKSHAKVHNTELVILSPASSAKTEQQNKHTAKARTRTSKNIKNLHSAAKNKTGNFMDSVPRYPIRNSRTPSHSQRKDNKINESSVTEMVSSEICTSPISTNEKRSGNKDPVKLPRSISKKNIKKLLHEEKVSAKCSPKSKDAKKPVIILNKVATNTRKDIYQNSPLQREANTNIQILDDLYFTPIKSNKKIKMSSKDSGVEINSINYTDEIMEHKSMPINKRNAKLINNTTLQLANTNPEININIVEPTVEISNATMQKEKLKLQREIIGNNELDGRSISTKNQNAKTEEEKRRTKKGNMKSSTKASHASSCFINLEPLTSVEPRTKEFTSKLSKSPKFNSPKKLTKTNKRETHEMVVPKLPPKKSRKTREKSPNKRQLRSDSVSLLSTKQNSVEQSIVINSNRDKRKTLKNNEKNSSNELAITKAPVKKSKKLKQNTTQDKNFTWNNADCVSSLPNRSERSKKYNMTDGGIDYDFSESSSQKTGKHKTNSTQTVDQHYDAYVNNKCIALVTPLSAEEIEKYTKNKSSEPVVQSTMNDQRRKSVTQTINGSSKAKSRPSSKKPRKQKSFGETYFGDPVKMSLMIKLKRKRKSKEKQSINTTDLAANSSNKSINSTNNVTRKGGKRKFYNDTDWLNSQECLQMFAENNEPCRPQNFCLQVEENNVEHDYFDDDVISEVSAFAKV